jgi:hypothetical protein
LAAGGVRFWYNVWNDLPQLGGGSEQGLSNPMVMPAQWETLIGADIELARLWLKLMGVDVALVNEKHSRDYYRDWVVPEKFRGQMPVLHDDGAGNIVYQVSRRYPSLARVVDRAKISALPPIPGNGDLPTLTAWHDVVENGPDAPTQTRWEGTDRLHIRAPVREGQSVFVQVSYDMNWRAYSAGERLPVRNTQLGFVLIDAPPGNHDIVLDFPTPFSNRVGRVVTLLSMAAAGALVWYGRRVRT